MNLEELKTFLAVVEAGSLIAASRRLNVTQSTVTARINALEDEIGQKLLHRNKSGAELTSPGFKFKRYAELMVQLWRQARYEVSLPKGFVGVCNLGLDFDLWDDAGRTFLEFARAEAPGVALAIWPGEQRQLDRWLSIGLIDVAFCYAPQSGGNFATRTLLDDELILVSDKPMTAPDLGPSYVYVDHGEEFRRLHAAAYPGDTTSALTIASSQWAIDHLLRSGGAGYITRRHAKPWLAAGRLHHVAMAPHFTRRAYVVEVAQATAAWPWFEAAIAAVHAACHRDSGNFGG
ncbi:MAG: LysR family transcriptional regulator [Hyphomicrobiales bacterium]